MDWGEKEPVPEDVSIAWKEVIERSVDPNPSVSSFEQFQANLFSEVNIHKHLESRKIKPLQLEIPLCRLMPTTWVRQALPADVQTVYDGFDIGNWGTNFWVTCCGSPGEFPRADFDDLPRWSIFSEKFDSDLIERC